MPSKVRPVVHLPYYVIAEVKWRLDGLNSPSDCFEKKKKKMARIQKEKYTNIIKTYVVLWSYCNTISTCTNEILHQFVLALLFRGATVDSSTVIYIISITRVFRKSLWSVLYIDIIKYDEVVLTERGFCAAMWLLSYVSTSWMQVYQLNNTINTPQSKSNTLRHSPHGTTESYDDRVIFNIMTTWKYSTSWWYGGIEQQDDMMVWNKMAMIDGME